MYIFQTFQDKTSKWEFSAVLDNVLFYFKFRWNTREGAYYMDILDENKNPLLLNMRVVKGYNMLEQYYAIPELPRGCLEVVDTNSSLLPEPINYDNFGVRYVLKYFSVGE